MTHDAAAWWQAIISAIAIIASGSIAVFVPWNEGRQQRSREDRTRLDVDAKRSIDGGLELLLVYRPEFHHYALSAAVRLLSPSDSRLCRGKLLDCDISNGRPKGVKESLNTNLLYHGVPLLKWEAAKFESPFIGMMYVEYPDERRGPGRAKLEISILAHGNFLIARAMIEVSATDTEFFPNGPPQIMVDMRADPHKTT